MGNLKGKIKLGVAQIDITPKEGIHLCGNVGCYRPSRVAESPLYAKALVLECNGKKICFVTLDLLMIDRSYTDKIRKVAVEQFGFEYDAIMIHPLQIHSAPSIGNFILTEDIKISPDFDWVRGGDNRYNSFAVEKIIQAIKIANESLMPVKVGVGSGIEGRMSSNRRAVMRDDNVTMPWFWNPLQSPIGNTDICYMEGPMDPEVGVVCFREDSLHILSILVNYTCHPVIVYGKSPFGNVVSSDWPGALADELEKAYNCIPLVLNGACGNINPWSPFDPDYWKRDHKDMGKTLAEVSQKVISKMDFEDEVILDYKVKHIKIPIREIEPKKLKEVKELLKENPIPIVWANKEKTQVDLKWFRETLLPLNVHLLREREPEMDYEIQVFRVGNTAFVGLPGEPFVEGGLKIKILSPAYKTYIVHMVNHYVGYIPTKDAFRRGGHEVNTTTWSKLVPEALDIIVNETVSLLKEVFIKGDEKC